MLNWREAWRPKWANSKSQSSSVARKPYRKYWVSSGSQGTAEEAPAGLGRTEVVEAATLNEAIDAVQRKHPDCTVMLAGGEHHVA